MTTFFSVTGIMSFIFAVGCIDGGYNGVPMNDNWLGFSIFTIIGIVSMFIVIINQKGEDML